MKTIEETYQALDESLRKVSIAQIGGFRPPENKITSWFGGNGVGLKGEKLPQYNGRDMFTLVQIRIDELPFIPSGLENTKFIVVFFNREEIPFDKENGNGWLIREYGSLDGLDVLPDSSEPQLIKDFPMKWSLVEDDAPNWENAWDLVDLTPINDREGADDKFFDEYNKHPGTKFGGFPYAIQHGVDLEDYIFQIGSEEKPNWMWGDNGIAYFKKTQEGIWTFECQFY